MDVCVRMVDCCGGCIHITCVAQSTWMSCIRVSNFEIFGGPIPGSMGWADRHALHCLHYMSPFPHLHYPRWTHLSTCASASAGVKLAREDACSDIVSLLDEYAARVRGADAPDLRLAVCVPDEDAARVSTAGAGGYVREKQSRGEECSGVRTAHESETRHCDEAIVDGVAHAIRLPASARAQSEAAEPDSPAWTPTPERNRLNKSRPSSPGYAAFLSS